MFLNKMSKQKKREILTKLCKKSIIFKPLVWSRLYRVSKKIRKNAVKNALTKYTDIPNLSKKEKQFLRRDMVYARVKYNVSYVEYFLYNFREKSHFERKNFIPNLERTKYLKLLNTKKGYENLTDKYKAYKIFKKYYKRELIKIEKPGDYEKFIKYIKKHPVFVVKPYNASFGKGIELIDSNNFKNKKTLYKELLERGTMILEELIVQDDIMSSLHPNSVNTLRIVTYKKPNGDIVIHLPFIKVGQKGSFVDNGGAGGILALIDEKTGVIITDGKDELNNVYEVHPDTNVKFKGFQIPKWEEVKELAKQAANEFEEATYIGWDIAISKEKGPVIVEGNGRTQFIGQQITDEKGKRKDLEKLINYRKLKRKAKKIYKENWGE